MPVSFFSFPGLGALEDATQAVNRLWLSGFQSESGSRMVALCDRPEMSQDRLQVLKGAGVRPVILLHPDSPETQRILEKHVDPIPGTRQERWTVLEKRLVSEGGTRYLHFVLDPVALRQDREALEWHLERGDQRLWDAISRGIGLTEEELAWFNRYFQVTVSAPKRAESGPGWREKGRFRYQVRSAIRDQENIAREKHRCGYRVLTTSDEWMVDEILEAFRKRETSVRILSVLKEASARWDDGGSLSVRRLRGLVWFTASVLAVLLKEQSAPLRKWKPEAYDLRRVLDRLEGIEGDWNQKTRHYERRYALTGEEQILFQVLGISEEEISGVVKGLSRV